MPNNSKTHQQLPPTRPRGGGSRGPSSVVSGLSVLSGSTASSGGSGGFNDNASHASDSTAAGSVSSSYRHHQSGPFMPQNVAAAAAVAGGVNNGALVAAAEEPKPVLVKDARHKPKTVGSLGMMIVGLGGANGTTLLAGILANRMNLSWKGPVGQHRSANYLGCITQLKQRGAHGGVGYADKVRGLAEASMAAVGGWDIRPAKPGDALLEAQILDYDLVRQVKDEMNKIKVFRGLYDPRFIGSSQHGTATHVLTDHEAPTDSEALKCLRADIRYFKWRNGVVGHTTVIWSASVEPNSELILEYETADELLSAIEMSEEERGGALPPSLLYATAALLEGCSFVNGGSQNTLSCQGLAELAQQQTGVYCLGTDFKAGQTKFKTAAVEYLRTIGLQPRVIASSNHLGNNDMRNLATAKTASSAKLRVKHNIFGAWQEDQLDHKVSIMYCPEINDEKRDFVEYTSAGFLGQAHTMVTYTRASDSVLCVPLMLDGAVWCDYFSGRSWPYEKVAKALSYLFKVPEGAATGVDPGFFRQMQELDAQVMAAHHQKSMHHHLKRSDSLSNSKKKKVRIRPEEKSTEWAIPHDARIICAGLACVDMQLQSATGGDGGESIETFEGEKSIAGGSVSMACKTLARLCHGAALDDERYMQVTPPVVHSVVPLCCVGHDSTGDKLISLLEDCGQACRNVETKYIKQSREKDRDTHPRRTALAVLPIYRDGRRGCFFDAASNTNFSAMQLVEMMNSLSSGATGPAIDTSHLTADDIDNYHADLEQMTPLYGAFLFGYPHLLPLLQGEALAQILLEARSCMIEGGITVLDLNGVPEEDFQTSDTGQQQQQNLRSASDLKNDAIIGPALDHVDILHLNEDELVLLTGCHIRGTPDSQLEDDLNIVSAVNLFLVAGVAVVALTRGSKGSFVACNDAERFKRSAMLPSSWVDCTAKVGAVQLAPGTRINANGAGDSFTAGLLVAAMLRHTGMTVQQQPQQEGSESGAASGSDAGSSSNVGNPGSRSPPPPKPGTRKKKMTPYTLYMRENYVMLKRQLHDDKKAIFSRCHEMWENESDKVKALYERKAEQELQVEKEVLKRSAMLDDDLEALDSTNKPLDQCGESSHHSTSSHGAAAAPPKHRGSGESTVSARNTYMTNRSLHLESAVQFASLVAAYHVDVSARDRLHIDVTRLLERALVLNSGLEEI